MKIKPGKRPLTFYDVDEAKQFIGKACYFSDKFEDFEDLDKLHFLPCANLFYIDESKTPFQYYGADGVICSDRYMLPCEWVEDKAEYRAYTLDEFRRAFDIGDVFKIRSKHTNYTAVLSYNGYSKSCMGTYIHLGADKFTLDELFKIYEIGEGCGSDETWHPFGIEDF